jgi:3-methyladenine DNA glycosylase AlkD
MNYLLNDLMALQNDDKAITLSRFFKTGEGEYGYGDKFLGITVPLQREVVKKYYKDISLHDIEMLLHDEYHEMRLSALIALTYKMKQSSVEEQANIVKLYLENTKYINNWDLVDLSAAEIVGAYLYNNKLDRTPLYDLADSSNLWEQRIAIVTTHYFIKHNEFDDTINISKILIENKHDLIHKAVGWMLREVGKRNYEILYNFLLEHCKQMPRTMLRYAIERFDPETRMMFLKS